MSLAAMTWTRTPKGLASGKYEIRKRWNVGYGYKETYLVTFAGLPLQVRYKLSDAKQTAVNHSHA